MKQRWQQLAARIDALTLRERAIMFVVLLVCCMALADALWLSPAQIAHKQVTLQFETQGQEMQRLRDELKTLATPVDVNQQTRDDMAAVQQEIDAINRDIHAVAPLAQGGPAIEPTLVQLLRRQDGLTLLGTATAATPPTPAASGASLPLRQALELRVAGSYADLTRYIATLENALPTLRWGALQLKATPRQPELTVELVLLGVPP